MTVKEKLKNAASHGKTLIKYGLSGGAGGGIGLAISEYSKYAADINFQVRPEVANLDFWGAVASGHIQDWLFKMSPGPMTALTVVSCALTSAGIVYYLTKE